MSVHRTIHYLVSDISGEELDDESGQSIKFSHRGVQYRLDLTNDEADAFDAALAPYLNGATRIGGRKTPEPPKLGI